MLARASSKAPRRWPLLLAAGALPLLLGLAFTFYEARQFVKRDIEALSHTTVQHAETIATHAWSTVSALKHLAGQPCDKIEPTIQRLGSLSAYFRSVGVTRGEQAYCSSGFGHESATMATILREPLPAEPTKPWARSVPGTLWVEDRPAVLFADMAAGGFGSYAIVDGQYLLDFMHALVRSPGYRLSMAVGGGHPLQVGPPIRDSNLLFPATRYQETSARFDVVVTIISPPDEAIRSWWRAFFLFLPMAAILSACSIAVAAYWLRRKLSFRDEISKGIAHDEFSVHYQPVYDIAKGTCSGAEALLRWQRADGFWVRPDVFVAAAEAEGMITELTRHLFSIVARDLDDRQVPPGFHLALNVAADHLQHPGFVNDVRHFARQIAHHRINLTLELTERSLISDGAEVVQRLNLLRKEGICLSIDDFGTGHCAMSYLQTFPLDYLKVDRGFVNAIESADGETPVLDAIIGLSHKLALGVVAEGVETPMQFDYLKRHGVAYIQGYLYARPMPIDELVGWLPGPGEQVLRGGTPRAVRS